MFMLTSDVLLSTVFVKVGILCFLQYKDYENILLFALFFDMFYFYKNLINVLHHGDNNFVF